MSGKQTDYMSGLDVEKDAAGGSLVRTADVYDHEDFPSEEHEVFKATADGENYRTVSW